MSTASETLHMVVEQTRRYPMRMIYDPGSGTFSESDSRSLCAVRGFTRPYGWIRESGTPPAPHWDCILMADGDYELGAVVEIRVIGLFRRGDGDHKYVAVETQRPVDDLSELSEDELDQLHRLYPRAGEGEGWFGRETAHFCMAHHEKAL